MQAMSGRICRWICLILFSLIQNPVHAQEISFEDAEKNASGKTVDWFMYGGFPSANAYVNGYVAQQVKERYGITLRQVPVKDIAEVVSRLVVEKQAGKTKDGEADLLWINGENFRTCKKNGLLFGPFADRLPNTRYVGWDKPFVKNDFGEPVDFMESPWGSAQVVMIHDTARTPDPPESMKELIEWIRNNPGKFTYPAPPDFTGSVFVRHVFYHVSGEVDKWQGGYTQEEFNSAANKTFDLLRGLRPYLWRKGSTYPDSPLRLSHLLADGEVEFSISYHPAEASKMILDGLFPKTVRTFVFREGTIANTHFVAIPFNAGDKEAAMVVANFLLSPEAQLHKAHPEVWGDFPAIDIQKLSRKFQKAFHNLPRGPATLPNMILQSRRLPEPRSSVLIKLEKGWEEKVLKGR